jgi:hypothetical protein
VQVHFDILHMCKIDETSYSFYEVGMFWLVTRGIDIFWLMCQINHCLIDVIIQYATVFNGYDA